MRPMKSIFWKYVGSYDKVRNGHRDLDIRTFYLTNYAKRNFHTKRDNKMFSKTIDFDYWELEMALLDIINGGRNIYLYNTLFKEDYKPIDNFGKILVENYDKLQGKNLIESALKYIDWKKSQIEDRVFKNNEISDHKILYYICKDLEELIWYTNENKTPYLMDNKIMELKQEKISLEEGYDMVEKVKEKILDLKIENKPNRRWVYDFISEVYEDYNRPLIEN